ncbi:hypothetical protein [Salmonella enterica]|uniref:Uncharacterized protein n=2 Tax=Salmonella enterica TaxID=28901 RepID=A0A379QHG1_SALER|nr:hypothetical protein [Salmonella enterica]ECC1654862.1 hypothetical protein [Salmonella enterica subsp. salamae]ASG87600.1 hypothetical protein LFZ47_08390 [Salmonella enterica subsp. salamae serovar 55:k:z39 str. 1315K]ECD9413656.1 hypothetical protein [Salmonella enterica subsp. salamae]ECF5930108.1 hypothetical protein [Salmonella enterica subsp. salamae]ECG1248885.1 hypothetical protein [Salmonella enterica subsp. salamae]
MLREIYIKQSTYVGQHSPYPSDSEELRIGLGYYLDGNAISSYFVRIELPVAGVINEEYFPTDSFYAAISRYSFYCEKL